MLWYILRSLSTQVMLIQYIAAWSMCYIVVETIMVYNFVNAHVKYSSTHNIFLIMTIVSHLLETDIESDNHLIALF